MDDVQVLRPRTCGSSISGLEVAELNVWLPLVDHVEEQLGPSGRLLSIDVDACGSCPTPLGASPTALEAHQKTTIVAEMVDRGATVGSGYFHNAGYFELEGDDFDGVLHARRPTPHPPAVLPPYVELVRLDRRPPPISPTPALVAELAVRRRSGPRSPRARRPGLTNPIVAPGRRHGRRSSRLWLADPGHRDPVPPLRLRHLPAGRRHRRAGRRASSTGSTSYDGPSAASSSPAARPDRAHGRAAPRRCSSPWPCGCAWAGHVWTSMAKIWPTR